MAFEIVFPTGPTRSLERGKASISKPGKLRVNAADLAAIKVTSRASDSRVTLLADFATGRIAVRKARDGDPSLPCTFSKRGGGSTRFVRVCREGRGAVARRIVRHVRPGR